MQDITSSSLIEHGSLIADFRDGPAQKHLLIANGIPQKMESKDAKNLQAGMTSICSGSSEI